MKITIRNLGAIKEAEFDLKPLTILIGPNNAGKTWLAYTLAGIFGPYGWRKYTKDDKAEEVAKLYPPIIQVVDKIMAKGTARIDLVRFAQEFGEAYFNDVAQFAREWLPNFLNTRLVDFKDLSISVHLDDKKTGFLDRVLSDRIHMDFGITGGDEESKPTLSIQKKQENKYVYLYTMSEGSVEEELPREFIEARLMRRFLRALHQALYPTVATLPTERSTFITEPFNALMEITSSLSSAKGNVSEDPPSSASEDLPSSSFISLMRRLMTSTVVPVLQYREAARRASAFGSKEEIERAKLAEEVPQIQEYRDLAQLLEQKILGGGVDFSTQEPEPMREIRFQPDEAKHPLELSITSSMVKELTPLVFYLRYFATPGELLIIDEPEMNLHPEAQVKIVEFLAMLVNAGLHVLVTTHSPYVVDHLLSLRKASEYADQEAISDRFFLQSKNAFISQQNSAGYLVDHGTIKNILDEEQEEEEREEDTFGKISDRISEIYFSF